MALYASIETVKCRYALLSSALFHILCRAKAVPRTTALVYSRYVGVYTLRASRVPGKYVNILSAERNEEALFLLGD